MYHHIKVKYKIMIDFSFNYNNDFKGNGFDIFILYLVKHNFHSHNPI